MWNSQFFTLRHRRGEKRILYELMIRLNDCDPLHVTQAVVAVPFFLIFLAEQWIFDRSTFYHEKLLLLRPLLCWDFSTDSQCDYYQDYQRPNRRPISFRHTIWPGIQLRHLFPKYWAFIWQKGNTSYVQQLYSKRWDVQEYRLSFGAFVSHHSRVCIAHFCGDSSGPNSKRRVLITGTNFHDKYGFNLTTCSLW